MTNSDIILKENHVEVKGELKVDSLSSASVNKPVSINSVIDATVVRFKQSTNRNALTINQSGIDMFDSGGSSVISQFSRAGNLLVGGAGIIRATNLFLSGKANIEKIDSSQISLGGSGNGENRQNGKITMVNAQGQVVLTIDAKAAAQIIVPGVGDLIDVVKKLQERVTRLERSRRP